MDKTKCVFYNEKVCNEKITVLYNSMTTKWSFEVKLTSLLVSVVKGEKVTKIIYKSPIGYILMKVEKEINKDQIDDIKCQRKKYYISTSDVPKINK